MSEYQADNIEKSKFTRLIGSAVTIANRVGQGFNVYLPVVDEESSKLHTLIFNKSLTYLSEPLDKSTLRKCTELMTKKKVDEKDFALLVEKLALLIGKRS